MSRKPKKFYSPEIKRKAVDEYLSGAKSTAQISAELGIGPNMVYRWRAELDAKERGEKTQSLESQGLDPKLARRFLEIEDELLEYQKKVAEQAIQIDLLKKVRGMGTCLPESELTGLINTVKLLARKRRRVK